MIEVGISVARYSATHLTGVTLANGYKRHTRRRRGGVE